MARMFASPIKSDNVTNSAPLDFSSASTNKALSLSWASVLRFDWLKPRGSINNIMTKRAIRIGKGRGGFELNPLYAKPRKHTIADNVNQRPALAKPSDSASTLKRIIPNA